jgi:hypothetical protein
VSGPLASILTGGFHGAAHMTGTSLGKGGGCSDASSPYGWGLVEITFDAPENAPAHKSDEQEHDELEFLSGLTGLPIRETEMRDASYAVWLFDRPEAGTFVNTRDPQVP